MCKLRIHNLKWITNVYACVCTTYLRSILYTIFDSVISELPRYHSTPATFLMSVSSASLSPRSKSTVRKAASCGHDDNATSRATWCSMMAEEPLPPKSASTTSFRCKDGRSARPHRGCWFDPNIGQEQGKYWNRDASKMVWKMFWNDEDSGILVFSGTTLWNLRAHPSKNSKVKPPFTFNCSTFLAYHLLQTSNQQ